MNRPSVVIKTKNMGSMMLVLMKNDLEKYALATDGWSSGFRLSESFANELFEDINTADIMNKIIENAYNFTSCQEP